MVDKGYLGVWKRLGRDQLATDSCTWCTSSQRDHGAKRKQGGATKGDAGTPANLRESEKRTSSMLPLIGFDPIDKQTEGPRSPSGKSEDKES